MHFHQPIAQLGRHRAEISHFAPSIGSELNLLPGWRGVDTSLVPLVSAIGTGLSPSMVLPPLLGFGVGRVGWRPTSPPGR